jgi:peptidyl-tRNA hydrolase
LAKGYQAVQSCHALREFASKHPDIDREWYSKSNYLGLLSVKDEYDLKDMILKASHCGIKYAVFREPDIGNQITAIALEPGSKAKKLCARLPLALRE